VFKIGSNKLTITSILDRNKTLDPNIIQSCICLHNHIRGRSSHAGMMNAIALK
jgi:hypothetical protein